jgi:hypothetical protein
VVADRLVPMMLPNRYARIAVAVGKKLGAPYWAGVVLVDGTPGYINDDGDFVPGQPATQVPCKVQIDSASEAWRAQAGYTDKDYRFIILADGLAADLNTDAKVQVTDATAPADFRAEWAVSALQRDPAGIGWSGKGRLV